MRQRDFHGFTWDPDEEKDRQRERTPDERCTPERLLAFIRETVAVNGRMPTLGEIKSRYGGILGAYVDYWELERRGLIKDGKLTEKAKQEAP